MNEIGCIPKLYKIRQDIPSYEIEDIHQATQSSIETLSVAKDLSGLTIGIAVGSRGIDNLIPILRSIIHSITEQGGEAIIIPAMGSHGGGTEQGQLEVLEGLGITEHALQTPILCCSRSTLLGYTEEGIPVYCSNAVSQVDHIVPVNRIKSHTDFTGKIESGICKMLAVGLGNQDGAMTVHAHALVKGYEAVITSVAAYLINKIPILFAVGILENWKGRTTEIKAFLSEDIIGTELALLAKMKADSIKLPFNNIDVLVIDQFGKNISGTGMDTKVIGRIMVRGQKEPDVPVINRVVVLHLTPESHGNATRIGLADITTMNVFHSVDIKTTAINSISSMSPEQGRLPCILENDLEAIKAAIFTLGIVDIQSIKMVYIRDTLSLEYLAVSAALLSEVNANASLTILDEGEELRFDENGRIISMWENK